MAIDFVELAANFDERLAIVLVKPDDHRIEPSERSAKRNLELFVAARVFFGIWEFVLERFLAGLRFSQILLYNIERFSGLVVREGASRILELRIAQRKQQLGFVGGIRLVFKFRPPLFGGLNLLGREGRDRHRECNYESRKWSEANHGIISSSL
jgi:hypothetical protein